MKRLGIFFGMFFAASAALAQLPAVKPEESSNAMLWLVLAAVVFVAAAIYLHRRFPSETAKAEAQGKAELAKAIGDLRVTLATKLADKTGATEDPAIPVLTSTPGKQGQAGPLTVQCTGDPRTDNAAWQAAYFG